MSNIIAYIRTGIGMRESQSFSIESQEEAISTYAKRKKLSITLWVRDRGVSTSTPLNKRENGLELCRKLGPNDVILCTEPGRLFAHNREAVEHIKAWKSMDVHVHFISLGGEIFPKHTEMLLGFLKSMAYEERMIRVATSQRTKELLRGEAKVSGGRPPFAFKIDESGKSAYDQSKSDALLFIIKQHESGMSNRWISRELLTRFQEKLSYNAVKRAIDRVKDDKELMRLLKITKDVL